MGKVLKIYGKSTQTKQDFYQDPINLNFSVTNYIHVKLHVYAE